MKKLLAYLKEINENLSVGVNIVNGDEPFYEVSVLLNEKFICAGQGFTLKEARKFCLSAEAMKAIFKSIYEEEKEKEEPISLDEQLSKLFVSNEINPTFEDFIQFMTEDGKIRDILTKI